VIFIHYSFVQVASQPGYRWLHCRFRTKVGESRAIIRLFPPRTALLPESRLFAENTIK